ncbi:MAG: peptidase T [Lachnospiraceae bacterium]|nr:peptidase T [Lachnospiraceae bacterium]
MEKQKYSDVIERFLRYVQIDTESVPDMESVPSSEKQKNLASLLVEELKEIGASSVQMDAHGYVYAEIPSTMKRRIAVPVLGFIAHMDTAPAMSGKNVKPSIISNYNGTDIVLNKEQNIVLSPVDFPELSSYKGQDLIVTDGTTLLGADDKAGVAEIMSMAKYLLEHPEIEHGTIKIGFTPDEEVGRGADFFDVKGFGAEFAYTVDGGALGELEYETFHAAGGKLTIHGKSIHPGSAKGQMINAILVAMEFQSLLPTFDNPAYTEKYEGFYHLDLIKGTVDTTIMDYIIRDHDMQKFEKKKEFFLKAVEFLNEKYGKGTIEAVVKDTYYNMKEKILPHMHLIENAKLAMERLGITPIITPVRGGTDGCRLSYMGLPCPNICTGGMNYHGRYEYISIQSMEKVVRLLLEIISVYQE